MIEEQSVRSADNSQNEVALLVITGLVTQGCIKATSAGALEQGYGVILVEDGHSSFSKQAAELIVKWNQKLGEMGAELRKASQVNFGNYR
jgi:nicotinamidase-related amidase